LCQGIKLLNQRQYLLADSSGHVSVRTARTSAGHRDDRSASPQLDGFPGVAVLWCSSRSAPAEGHLRPYRPLTHQSSWNRRIVGHAKHDGAWATGAWSTF